MYFRVIIAPKLGRAWARKTENCLKNVLHGNTENSKIVSGGNNFCCCKKCRD